MQNSQLSIKSFLLGSLIFVALSFLGSNDCHAQLHRGRLGQSLRAQRIERQNQNRQFRAEQRAVAKIPNAMRYEPGNYQVHGPASVYQSKMMEAYPKYIGGFHAGELYKIGVPHGDNGFRGNGILWTPW